MSEYLSGVKILLVNYGFRDASGMGFGSSWVTGKNRLKCRYGVWGSDKYGESSNFKELKNLVDTLKEMTRDRDGVRGVELFLFTDNSVAEGTLCEYTAHTYASIYAK